MNFLINENNFIKNTKIYLKCSHFLDDFETPIKKCMRFYRILFKYDHIFVFLSSNNDFPVYLE